MTALDATVGGVSANSYVSVDQADTYFGARLNTDAWDALSADVPTKERALMAATARLEQERYVGAATSFAQALKWPRMYVTRPDDAGPALEEIADGPYRYPPNVIPAPVVAATCELALYLLNSGATDPLQPAALAPFESVSVGPIDIKVNADYGGGQLPPQVTRCLSGLRKPGGGFTRLVRA